VAVVVINKASVLEKLETPSFFEKNKNKRLFGKFKGNSKMK
jgi:hypothetical protein